MEVSISETPGIAYAAGSCTDTRSGGISRRPGGCRRVSGRTVDPTDIDILQPTDDVGPLNGRAARDTDTPFT